MIQRKPATQPIPQSLDKGNGTQVNVHLCCGSQIRRGWLNVDAVDCGQEVVADLNADWDFLQEGTVDYLYCKDGFEHQNSIEHFLKQATRVLKVGGILEIWVPHYKNPSAYRITHRYFFSWSCFDAFPEPHDAVKDLKVISNKIYIGWKESRFWYPVHYVVNKCPRWWERLFYVSNIEVKLQKLGGD